LASALYFLALGVWLLVKGVNVPKWNEQVRVAG
jgi:hypothetical protein